MPTQIKTMEVECDLCHGQGCKYCQETGIITKVWCTCRNCGGNGQVTRIRPTEVGRPSLLSKCACPVCRGECGYWQIKPITQTWSPTNGCQEGDRGLSALFWERLHPLQREGARSLDLGSGQLLPVTSRHQLFELRWCLCRRIQSRPRCTSQVTRPSAFVLSKQVCMDVNNKPNLRNSKVFLLDLHKVQSDNF